MERLIGITVEQLIELRGIRNATRDCQNMRRKVMRKGQRRRFWLYTLVIVFAQLVTFEVPAQSYPNKPIRVLVGFAPGGAADVPVRLVAQKLTEYLGQQVVVENRTGAGGEIAIERTVSLPADGYNLLTLTGSMAILSVLRTHFPYRLERDLAPISLLVTGPFVVLIHPSVPVRNIAELIKLARSRPGQLSYGSSGVGSDAFLVGELFKQIAKVDILHVPFQSGALATMGNAVGEVQISYASITSARSLTAAGKLKPLAVTSIKRTSLAPSLPTLDESDLPGYERLVWTGLVALAGVPKDIITQLNTAIVKVVNTPEMKEALIKQGLEPQTNSPEQFAAFIHGDIAQNAKLIKSTGIRID